MFICGSELWRLTWGLLIWRSILTRTPRSPAWAMCTSGGPSSRPRKKSPRQKISLLQSWWRRSVDNLCSFHLKDHLKWFACSLVILDEWAAPHFTCAVTLWWIWSRVLSRPSRPVPMAGCSVTAGQVTCIYRPVSGWHWGHYCSCVVTSLTLHH